MVLGQSLGESGEADKVIVADGLEECGLGGTEECGVHETEDSGRMGWVGDTVDLLRFVAGRLCGGCFVMP